MNTKKTFFPVINIIEVLIYAVAMFVLVEDKTTVFYVVCISTIVAMLLQLAVWPSVGKCSDSVLFKLPAMRVSTIFCVIQIIWSVLAVMNFDDDSTKIAIVIQVVMLGIYIILLWTTISGMQFAKEVDDKMSQKTNAPLDWSKTSAVIYENLKGTALERKAKQLHDETTYGNPASNAECYELENVIQSKLNELLNLSGNAKDSVTEEMIEDYIKLIKQRNNILKTAKR